MDRVAPDLTRRYKRTHDRILSVAAELTDEQLRRRLERTNSDNRHLGMIEATRGALGLRGTATV